MSKSPRTPSSSTKNVLRFFSRTRKESLKEKHTPRLPTRSFTSSRGQVNENMPPKLRIDTQINRDTTVPPYMDILEKVPDLPPLPSITPYTGAFEKFPNPPPLPSDTPPREPLSSSRSLHNIQENEIQNAPFSPRPSNPQKRSKPRPKGLVLKPEVSWGYFLTNSPATALRDSQFHSFLSMVDDSHSPMESPIASSVPSQETAELVDLDDYPWYFAEMVDTDTEVLYGLSPPAFLPREDLCT